MTNIQSNQISTIKLYICAILPIILGCSNIIFNFLFNLQPGYNLDNSTLEAIRNNAQLVIFFVIIIYLLRSNFYNRHYLNIFNLKINTLLIYILICIFIATPMIFNTNISISNLAIAILFGPIIEGITTQSIFTVIDDKKKLFTLSLVLVSSLSFAIMHSIPFDTDNTSLLFIGNIKKYIQHFLYALYLSIITLYFKRIDISIFLHAAQNASYFLH